MTPSTKKRFWKQVDVKPMNGGFGIFLDEREMKTPVKSAFLVPSKALADAIAEEWRAVNDEIDPSLMPMTRRANAAIDKVIPQHAEVAAMLGEYGGTDLLCYRALQPQELADRQEAAWRPYLDWAEEYFAAPLQVTAGVVFVSQPNQSVENLSKNIIELSAFELTAFHDLVTLSGSLILAQAVMHDYAPPEDVWNASQADEAWQEEKWGQDDEATAAQQTKKRDFIDAYRFLSLLNATQ